MALSERSRTALYQGFSAIIDEEAVQEMLSFFPARDTEEPVTKEFLRAELSDMERRVNTRISDLELRLGSELRAEIRRTIWLNIGALTAFAAVIITPTRV